MDVIADWGFSEKADVGEKNFGGQEKGPNGRNGKKACDGFGNYRRYGKYEVLLFSDVGI